MNYIFFFKLVKLKCFIQYFILQGIACGKKIKQRDLIEWGMVEGYEAMGGINI